MLPYQSPVRDVRQRRFVRDEVSQSRRVVDDVEQFQRTQLQLPSQRLHAFLSESRLECVIADIGTKEPVCAEIAVKPHSTDPLRENCTVHRACKNAT